MMQRDLEVSELLLLLFTWQLVLSIAKVPCCAAAINHSVQRCVVMPFSLCRLAQVQWENKGTRIVESAPGSALTVQEPESGRPSFLTCQKFIRPSDGRSEAGNWPSPHPVNCPGNNAQWNEKKWPDSKVSCTAQLSCQKLSKTVQCVPTLRLLLLISHVQFGL